ncbi:unnamed protein product [Rhizophagus irregularis]|nr:unnamed protein product [Rhizophagus irregularis]
MFRILSGITISGCWSYHTSREKIPLSRHRSRLTMSEFFDVFIPAGSTELLALPMQFDIFGRRHQALIYSRKEDDIRS